MSLLKKASPGIPKQLDMFQSSLYPAEFIDYIWVITLYGIIAFTLAVTIDGHILPKFNEKEEEKQSTFMLCIEILAQLAIQGFIVICICALLQRLPSPVEGLRGYNSHSAEGGLMRNPAILSVILFALSKSLQGRLAIVFSRFDRNATP